MERGIRAERFEQSEDPTKDIVRGPVSTPSILPPIDNSKVVTVDTKVLTGGGDSKPNDAMDEQLESDGFNPPNVFLSTESAPSW